MLNRGEISELEQKALELRRYIINSILIAGSGHPGGSLSCADILTYLYNKEMKDDDAFHLSKGHAAPALYGTLIQQRILRPGSQLRRIYGLEGHPSNKTPGVDISSGSLGQGFSVASGRALGKKMKGKGNVYVLSGDGELQEPEPWSAMMSASNFQLNNLCFIVDKNNLQIDGNVNDIMSLGNLEAKSKSFGCNTYTFDGHNFQSIDEAFGIFHINRFSEYKPLVLIANTVKGKGISFMENQPQYHGSMTSEEGLRAIGELK